MQRKIYLVCLAFALLSFIPGSYAQQGKSEITIGYGYYSIYTLVNGQPFNVSSGTPAITYRYYLTRNFTLGVGVGTENISNWGTFTTIAPEITGTYLDTRNTRRTRVKLYGSFAYGIAIFHNTNLPAGQQDNSGVWAYGFQATPFGIRIGRQVAGFAEVGLGYKGLINGGLSVRFPRSLAHKHVAPPEQ